MTTADTLLTGWGRTAPTRSTVSFPSDEDAVRKVLASAASGRGVLARGLGRSYGDAAQNAGGDILDMTGLTGVHALDIAGATVTVDAGLSLDALLRHLVPLGLFVSVSPGTRYVTVGGAIACDIHGKNHHREGSFARSVLSFDLLTADGEVRTVTAERDSEVFWATAGGMGLTGVILRATLSLLRIETSLISVDTERASDLDDVMARMDARDDDYRYSVAWIDLLATGAAMGRSVLTRGDHLPLEALPPQERATALSYAPKNLVSAPSFVPPGLLNRLTVRAFNELWFRKAPVAQVGHPESIAAFFHPLDMVTGWNRIYGRAGFLQYQFVVPFGEEQAMRAIVAELVEHQCPSFLAVLKRFGAGNGLLSFPIPGWTLALDIPAAMTGLGPLLTRLDERVVQAGGRVYLAKDSRLSPQLLPGMYPELDRWREIRERLDPQRRFISDLARRLQLF
jgi:decaprenylphospho-beta-D-ribofuranose 2-oxidase